MVWNFLKPDSISMRGSISPKPGSKISELKFSFSSPLRRFCRYQSTWCLAVCVLRLLAGFSSAPGLTCLAWLCLVPKESLAVCGVLFLRVGFCWIFYYFILFYFIFCCIGSSLLHAGFL